MKTVVDEPIAEWLAANGYFYVMHRFDLDNVAFAKRMRDKGLFVSISSGVKPPDYDGRSTGSRATASAPTTSRSTSRTATPTACTG